MSTDKGYIKLYRDIQKHWIWQDAKYLKAWVDLIMMANHEDRQILFDRKLITVKRGSFITSIRKLAVRWGWGKDAVYTFLGNLESDGMIDRKSDSKKTLIIIVKYGFYQGRDSKNQTVTGTQTRTLTGTVTGTQTRHKQYTNKGTKEDTKEKETISTLQDEPGEPWDDEGWQL